MQFPSNDFGRRAERRLREEGIIWLTTVDRSGRPQPRPVWFLWDGESILIYSQPGAQKIKHIVAKPHVALNLDGDGRGGDIIVLIGDARVDTEVLPADQVPAYVEKYAWGFERIGMTAAQFAATYSVALRVTPVHLRGH